MWGRKTNQWQGINGFSTAHPLSTYVSQLVSETGARYYTYRGPFFRDPPDQTPAKWSLNTACLCTLSFFRSFTPPCRTAHTTVSCRGVPLKLRLGSCLQSSLQCYVRCNVCRKKKANSPGVRSYPVMFTDKKAKFVCSVGFCFGDVCFPDLVFWQFL